MMVEAPSEEIMLEEQKPLEVDAFARYRIIDPFCSSSVWQGTHRHDRLGSLLNASLRSVFGTITMAKFFPGTRRCDGQNPRRSNGQVKELGIEIVDVRIRRTDLPQKTSDAVFTRMASQRAQEAAQIRATGQQEALQITSDADRQATVILAEAQGKAER